MDGRGWLCCLGRGGQLGGGEVEDWSLWMHMLHGGWGGAICHLGQCLEARVGVATVMCTWAGPTPMMS